MDSTHSKSPLLDLPAELRAMILQHYFCGAVLYTRSTLTKVPSYDAPSWCNKTCSPLLLVSRQISAEALEAMMHTCVIDIWGTAPFYTNPRFLPLVSKHIRHAAVSGGRGESCALAVQRMLLTVLTSTRSPKLHRLSAIFGDFVHRWGVHHSQQIHLYVGDQSKKGLGGP